MADVRWLVAFATLAGCGRISFEPLATPTDDAAATASCTRWNAFGAPVHVAELGAPGTDDWAPALSSDGLSIYFFSGRSGGLGNFDIWTATRASIGATWSTPVAVTAVNSPDEERAPWISSDGLTLGFSTDRPGGLGLNDLWWSTRPDTASAWGTPQPIPNVNTPGVELDSHPSANGLRLYIAAASATSGLDIYVASRTTTADNFSAPVRVDSLDSNMNESHIAVSADELEAFVITNRTGAQGDDVYVATRPDLASPFSTPTRVSELDTPMDESCINIMRDGTTAFLNYSAVSAGGDAEIWTATRTCAAF